MAQTVLSVVIEVQPQSADVLRGLISDLRDKQSALEPAYADLRTVETLHFLSMNVFADDQYDPIFVLEANFDGSPGPFWAGLEAAIGPQLRDLLRCCKRPRGRLGAMFDAVTVAGASAPIAPLLEAQTVKPAVHHQGNRGLSRQRIEQEAQLFIDLRAVLTDPTRFQGQSPTQAHQALRAQMLPSHPWLTPPAPPRIGVVENLADWARLIGFVLAVVVILHLPGMLMSWILPPWPALIVLALLAAIFGGVLKVIAANDDPPVDPPPKGPQPKTSPPWGPILLGLLAVLVFEHLLAWVVARIGVWTGGSGHIHGGLVIAGLGLAGVVPTVLGIGAWLRGVEQRDASQDAPPVDAQKLRDIMALEDKVAQNHMGSVVHIKPGVLRTILVRAALMGLGLILRIQARSGYLGSMRTIHFAHWALVSNGGRLMFFSNFDGSWESYLDDFIEKAHAGLTLAWTSGVGFPPTRFLVQGGATQGRKFKAWARHSMAPSLFWFSGYRVLSVNQIERQTRIADGLRKPTLTPEEAARWTMDL